MNAEWHCLGIEVRWCHCGRCCCVTGSLSGRSWYSPESRHSPSQVNRCLLCVTFESALLLCKWKSNKISRYCGV